MSALVRQAHHKSWVWQSRGGGEGKVTLKYFLAAFLAIFLAAFQ
jgi:hypothetical protein